jgi:hypothetical protein
MFWYKRGILNMSEEKKPIKYHSITQKWGNKKFCNEISKRIDNWLNQFEENERPLMLSLLKNYKYYSEKDVSKKVVELFKCFNNNHEIDKSFAISPIEKEYGVGFSDIFFTAFWLKNNLYDLTEKNLSGLIEKGQIPANILIVDDYTGSGDTFINYIKKLYTIDKRICESKLFFLTLQASNIALKNIKAFCEKENILIECYSMFIQNRAFLDNCVCEEIELEIKRREYEDACSRIKISENYIFGYKEIEALISFEYNTPNNTLGVIWQEIDGFTALFKRHKKIECDLTSMRNKAKQNKTIFRTHPFICDIEETKINIFMVYIVAQGKSFSISKACVDFGFTVDQLDNILNYLFKNEYIIFQEGNPSATLKLKDFLFSSRLKEFKKIYNSLYSENKVPEYNFEKDIYLPKNFSDIFKGYKSKGG